MPLLLLFSVYDPADLFFFLHHCFKGRHQIICTAGPQCFHNRNIRIIERCQSDIGQHTFQSMGSLKSGTELTLKQLLAAFEKSGLKQINPLGEKFDPNFHQAISMVPSDQEPNTVVTVLQKGYLIAERVLRPALVMVAQAKS